jgi:hypothetical protein
MTIPFRDFENTIKGMGQSSPPAKLAYIFNLEMPVANTEYEITLPAGIKQFHIKSRSGSSAIRFSTTPGGTTDAYMTIERGTKFTQDRLSIVEAITLYFRTDLSNQVIEILAWA